MTFSADQGDLGGGCSSKTRLHLSWIQQARKAIQSWNGLDIPLMPAVNIPSLPESLLAPSLALAAGARLCWANF